MKVLIRQYHPEDYAERQAVALLCEQTAESKVGLGKPDHAPGLLTVNLVAVVGDRLVGFLDGDQVMAPDETGEVKAVVPPEGYILCMGVHPDFRRQQIGRRLLRAALQDYERAGCVRVELAAANDAVAGFYRECGGRIGDPDCPYSFEWRLPPEGQEYAAVHSLDLHWSAEDPDGRTRHMDLFDLP
jgi:ribosomal protein S18 acetylase RimI-like enzyme